MSTRKDNGAQGWTQKWTVKFSDKYVKQYERKELERILVRSKREKLGKQIDYIMVSSRWKSSIQSCRTRWQPAMHRDIHGEKNDHTLVECIWKWRMRVTKSKRSKDYTCLFTQGVDVNEKMQAFEQAIKQKLEEQQYSTADDNTTMMYDKMCNAIQHASDIVLEEREHKGGIRREVSEKTQNLFKKRTQLKGKGTQQQYSDVQKKIKASSLADFKSWVGKWSDVISEAAGKGDTRKIYEAVNTLACKQEQPSPNLTTDHEGRTLKCAEEVAAAWNHFLTSKFAATAAEHERDEMEKLPETKGTQGLTDAQINRGLARMGNNKACGQDNIPAELYKHSKECNKLLKELLKKIWLEEDVPIAFAQATFVMLYKHKGSSDDPTKYRCIGLLPHAYKVLTQCLLEQLEKETSNYLSEWQAGFRRQRGCRDNTLTLRTIYDDMLEKGATLYATYIDYSAAFDSVSHKFIDAALKKAGASNKSRALFRAIYKAASAVTKVSSTDGTEVKSKPFPIRRGVVQGDITSPLYFILALELILKTHDNIEGKGVQFGDRQVCTLGYADDAALLDNNLHIASTRVTAIAQGSKRDADMEISIPKTKTMHVKEQGRISPVTS